jgi:hypothetical protein
VTPFGLGRRRREKAADPARPILAVDIDGVLSLFGYDEPPEEAGPRLELIDGALHCVATASGDRLRRLAQHYDPVWATGWESGAAHISRLLDLPRWPALDFRGAARFGSADWKLAPLQRCAGARPLAWIDDSFDEACYAWARERREPTLLVDIEPDKGLQDVQVEALLGWARSLEAAVGEGA